MAKGGKSGELRCGRRCPPMTLGAEQRRALMRFGVSVQCRRVLKEDYRAIEDVISPAPPVFNPIRGAL